MRITTKTDYAIVILTSLARKSHSPVSLEYISNQTRVSEAYLQRIAARLKKSGLIKAKRGAYGGYMLKKPAEKIHLDQVVTAVGDNIHCVKCTDPKLGCPLAESCEMHMGWNKFQKKVNKLFASTTVADMVQS